MKFNKIEFQSVTSTNDVAADIQYTHGDIIVAHSQSAGRGQRGNSWHSRPGDNITFSLVVQPTHIKVCEQFSLSMAVALGVVGALCEYGIRATVKWPNDIYVEDKKICGILIEHNFSSEYLDKSVAGVGINVLQTQFASELTHVTSIALLGATGVTPQEVLDKFCRHFATLYEMRSIEKLHALYMKSLYRGEGFFEYSDKNGRFWASIAAIDPCGGVITLETKQGERRDYYFKEIDYIII